MALFCSERLITGRLHPSKRLVGGFGLYPAIIFENRQPVFLAFRRQSRHSRSIRDAPEEENLRLQCKMRRPTAYTPIEQSCIGAREWEADMRGQMADTYRERVYDGEQARPGSLNPAAPATLHGGRRRNGISNPDRLGTDASRSNRPESGQDICRGLYQAGRHKQAAHEAGWLLKCANLSTQACLIL